MRWEESVERMKIDSKMIGSIKALYEHFFLWQSITVKWMEKTICGIRPGCPDSEYFVSDVKRKNNDLHFRKAVNNMKFQ